MEIDEKQLYRIYKDERIYFNRYIYNLFERNSNIYKWKEDITGIQAGDWVEAEDGYVLKLLRIRTYKMVTFYFFVNCQTVVRKYSKKNSIDIKYYWSKFLGGYTGLTNNRGYLSKYPEVKIKKRTFATLVANGMHPYKAYRAAYDFKHTLSTESLNYKIMELVKDKEVIKIIKENKMEESEKFKQDMQEAFNDEALIKEMKLLLSTCRKGSIAHMEILKFILAISDKLPNKMYNKKKEIENTIEVIPYNEVPPPPKELN